MWRNAVGLRGQRSYPSRKKISFYFPLSNCLFSSMFRYWKTVFERLTITINYRVYAQPFASTQFAQNFRSENCSNIRFERLMIDLSLSNFERSGVEDTAEYINYFEQR